MAEVTEDQFRLLAEIQRLARIMKLSGSVRDQAFQDAQSRLTQMLNQLSASPTVIDRSAGGGGILA